MKFDQLRQRAQVWLMDRQRAYRLTFKKDDRAVRRVLRDLENFCYVNKPIGHQSADVRAMLEGRRQVFIHIQRHLKLSPDTLWELHEANRKDTL